MKIADIITRVRNAAGDTQVLQFTDQMVVDWINDGVRECAEANNLLQKRATINTTSGEPKLGLPKDILKLHSIKVNGSKIRMTTLHEFEETHDSSQDDTGFPGMAYVWAGTLNLYPIPDDVLTVTIDYIYVPQPVSIDNITTADPPLPVGYHSRLVDYCLAQVAQQDDDMNRYQLKMQEFMTGVSNLKDQPESENDVYPSIAVSARDQGYDDGYYTW